MKEELIKQWKAYEEKLESRFDWYSERVEYLTFKDFMSWLEKGYIDTH